MNAGAVPLLLLAGAIGFALAFQTMRAASLSAAAAITTALIMALAPIPQRFDQVITVGLLLSTLATAALVFLPANLRKLMVLAAAINGGAWMGAAASASSLKGELAAALPLTLLFIPGKWLTSRGYDIVIKVLSSWLVAIAALGMFVSLLPTPGYEADHME
ncbi:MAG: hypothetical protein H0W39_09745 [Sphingomonas sp.]|nr:hypothetical protein [Sphingomonas sp.]